MKCSETYGAWYNYVAATAGTIAGNPNTTDATKDVCPNGWRLPSHSEQSNIASYVTPYSPTNGGAYETGVIGNTSSGYWWSATSYSDANRWYLRSDNNTSLATGYYLRYLGRYVRCIRSQ